MLKSKGFLNVFYCFAIVAIVNSSCDNTSRSDKTEIQSKKMPLFRFEETSFDFGKIQDGDTVFHVFNFTNSGSAPLIINDVSTSCGCTAVNWPREPIQPQDAGQILIRFSKHHDPGLHTKTAIVKSNIKDSYTVLRIIALVEK